MLSIGTGAGMAAIMEDGGGAASALALEPDCYWEPRRTMADIMATDPIRMITAITMSRTVTGTTMGAGHMLCTAAHIIAGLITAATIATTGTDITLVDMSDRMRFTTIAIIAECRHAREPVVSSC